MKRRAWLVSSALLLLAAVASAQEAGAGTPGSVAAAYRSLGLGAVVAVTMIGSVFAAAYAVARIGAAVMGAAAEKPEVLTRSLVYVALAEGLAVLGFAISVMLLQKI